MRSRNPEYFPTSPKQRKPPASFTTIFDGAMCTNESVSWEDVAMTDKCRFKR